VNSQKLLLVDDNDLIRAGLKHVLEQLNCNVAGQASSLEVASQTMSRTEIDIVLLKHGMPDGNSIEFVKTLRTRYPNVKVLMLLEEDAQFWEALEAQADGYEIRHMPSYQLATAIKALKDDYGWLGPMLSRYLLKRGGRDRLKAAAKQTPVNEAVLQALSTREREVIYLLSEGLRGENIAEKLNISPKTVKLHVSNCIRKLGVEDRTQAIAKFLRCKQ
jgi:DNA-binding NarL/FixJ family response regulator